MNIKRKLNYIIISILLVIMNWNRLNLITFSMVVLISSCNRLNYDEYIHYLQYDTLTPIKAKC